MLSNVIWRLERRRAEITRRIECLRSELAQLDVDAAWMEALEREYGPIDWAYAVEAHAPKD